MIFGKRFSHCQCNNCSLQGWEGCPKADAEEKVMELERKVKQLETQLFSSAKALLTPNKQIKQTQTQARR